MSLELTRTNNIILIYFKTILTLPMNVVREFHFSDAIFKAYIWEESINALIKVVEFQRFPLITKNNLMPVVPIVVGAPR